MLKSNNPFKQSNGTIELLYNLDTFVFKFFFFNIFALELLLQNRIKYK